MSRIETFYVTYRDISKESSYEWIMSHIKALFMKKSCILNTNVSMSVAEYSLFCRALLQKRPMILWSLLNAHVSMCVFTWQTSCVCVYIAHIFDARWENTCVDSHWITPQRLHWHNVLHCNKKEHVKKHQNYALWENTRVDPHWLKHWILFISAQEWTNRTVTGHEPLICSTMCFAKTELVQ